MKITSNYMKAALCTYYRFGKSAKYIATECGRYYSDVLAICNGHLIEVEIKVSKADLSNDFKKDKHRIYETNIGKEVPNYFYFAVPQELVEFAVSRCIGKPYGVILVREPEGLVTSKFMSYSYEAAVKRSNSLLKTYKDFELKDIIELKPNKWQIVIQAHGTFHWSDRVKVIKRATKIHEGKATRQTQQTIVNRLSSEMTNLRVKAECKS